MVPVETINALNVDKQVIGNMNVEIEAPMAEKEEDSDPEVADLIEETIEEEEDLVIGIIEAHQDSMIEEDHHQDQDLHQDTTQAQGGADLDQVIAETVDHQPQDTSQENQENQESQESQEATTLTRTMEVVT